MKVSLSCCNFIAIVHKVAEPEKNPTEYQLLLVDSYCILRIWILRRRS